MAGSEYPTTPSGELVVDVLIQAYNETNRPNPFVEASGAPVEPRSPEADLVRGRIGSIAFAPYWGEKFQDWRDNFNGNPAGFFAQQIFRAAEAQDGETLLRTVALELGDKHPDGVLEAEIDLPGLEAINLNVPRLSSLASFMLERRELLGSGLGIINLSGSQDISDSWIRYTHFLLVQDVDRHDALLAELVPKYVEADIESRKIMEEWADMMGGYGAFDHQTALSRVIAGTLGAHLPELVVSHLTQPAIDISETQDDTGELESSQRELASPKDQ